MLHSTWSSTLDNFSNMSQSKAAHTITSRNAFDLLHAHLGVQTRFNGFAASVSAFGSSFVACLVPTRRGLERQRMGSERFVCFVSGVSFLFVHLYVLLFVLSLFCFCVLCLIVLLFL